MFNCNFNYENRRRHLSLSQQGKNSHNNNKTSLRPHSLKEVFAIRHKTSFCYSRRYFNSFRTCFTDLKTEVVTFSNC